MASVAICPHCYLQLVVPDGVDTDECVECPTCAKEFALDQAVLRAIPEVVRRPRVAVPAETAIEAADEIVVDELIEEGDAREEVVEIDELVTSADDAVEEGVAQRDVNQQDDAEASDVIEQIKARIEAEIAAKGLIPGTSALLPLELPADAAVDQVELSLEVEQPAADPTEWFRNAKTMEEIPAIKLPGRDETAAAANEVKSNLPELELPELDIADDNIADEELAAEAEATIADFAPEPLESRESKPTVRTLADLMPTEDAAAEEYAATEVEDTPGPSFDLPNVPLVPTNGSTIEFDSSMSFGPAAETEFELDSVDFEGMANKEELADEFVTEQPDAETEPVFREPASVDMPAAPFVLSALPRPRRKRSVVRMLAGTMIGGLVGLTIGYFVLLYLLGPEGDLLHVAKYIPSAVLPSSFKSNSTPIADAGRVPAPLSESAPATSESTPPEESANIPAGYVEETPATSESIVGEGLSGDERYDTEPAPLEEPAAVPIAEQSPVATPLPVRGPTFTVDQLATTIGASKAALAGLTTGDLNDPAVRRTKGMSYAKLCDLAEALTFVDRSSPSVESDDAIETATRLFRETLSDAHTRDEVTRIAEIWISSPHRTHGGVFLASAVHGGQIAGDVYEYETAVDDGNGGKIALLMREPLDASLESSEQPIGIIGTIVERPADDVAGYQGTSKRAIWGAAAVPLE
jgi:hypothetical protein